MNERLRQLTTHLTNQSLHAAIITNPKHVYYLSGFRSDPHERLLALIVTADGGSKLLVPQLDRAGAEASASVDVIESHRDTDDAYAILAGMLGKDSGGQLAIEKERVTVSQYERMRSVLPQSSLLGIDDALLAMRAVKTADEVARIKRAVQLIEQVLRDTLPLVKPGVTELELAADIDFRMRKVGAEGPSFDTTVLAGANSALPHGTPGNRKIAEGELLLFDMGVYADGYVSDITRTFAVGDVSDELKRIYASVLKANELGIQALKPGVPMMEADLAARRHIEASGYGDRFTHRLGHGIGLDIHEYPSLHGANAELLREGMVVTVEPGIYVPGLGGVRIEDDVLLTSGGSETLTTFPKLLTIIGV
ncbi:Xaa-Pro aminopeptidase [Paenibacillus cellulosilyticus]|uniref:Xaa-Pro aminopeptidase n=1 Tax=Paenibacillus cellulosilyticus TaxID=375489 RepID=A0A2V2YVW6_9BACL|nr:Xaa-Pro peptidase family protein [Paenibacillus cellulosilyticus]PWV95197.1 Xaa-Pro aminopeptidase [Paenibacillus cellulosilyticus]QKS46050.1 aminopeptidase P family protein [Paenibacillus cellulosilyticus]